MVKHSWLPLLVAPIVAAVSAVGCGSAARHQGTPQVTPAIQGAQGAQSAEGFLRPENVGALKTLLLPGGLGSTMKVLILGKGVETPHLRGCSYRVRIT